MAARATGAVNDSTITDAGKAVTVSVLNNDSDADGDALTISNVGNPLHGTAVANTASNSIIYTPTAGFTGDDTFTYRASDGTAESGDTVVTITVTPAGGQEIFVQSIDMGLVPTGKKVKGEAIVTIVPALADATVYGEWRYNGDVIDSAAMQLTDGSGVASLTSPPQRVSAGDVFTFTVSDIVLVGYTYAPGQNLETTDSVVVP